MAATAPDEQGRVNQALICGDSNGYTGPNALVGEREQAYRVRFAIRGTGGAVSVGTVAWPNDPSTPDDRVHDPVQMKQSVVPGDEWQLCEGTFVLVPAAAETKMRNARVADGSAPWSVRWRWEDGYTFDALFPGSQDESVRLGDGWGQRDHRNTDRGATLPYVIRRGEAPGALDVFSTVFVGTADARQPVATNVRELPLPAEAPAGTVALAVETSEGTDIVVSMLDPAAVTIETPAGPLSTDARLAVVSLADARPVRAQMVEGTTLRLSECELTLDAPAFEGEITGSGSEAGRSWFEAAGAPEGGELTGDTLLVEDGEHLRAYPIRGVEPAADGLRVLTKLDGTGFVARSGERWRIPRVASWEG
ncbi:MAG TPA: hypothetical protein DEP45_04040 [Armatimonadetes bacterium]|nr:hypothetical protein [Armatimonadota bacterium]